MNRRMNHYLRYNLVNLSVKLVKVNKEYNHQALTDVCTEARCSPAIKGQL